MDSGNATQTQCPPFPQDVVNRSQRVWLQGTTLATFEYGIVVTLTLMCLYRLFGRLFPIRQASRQTFVMLIFMLAMFTLSTSTFVSTILTTEHNFIDVPCFFNKPPVELSWDIFQIPARLGNTCTVLITLCGNALMLWRCWVVYSDCIYPPWVFVLLPGLTYASSAALGLYFMVKLNTGLGIVGANISIVFLSLSLTMNSLVTILIVSRLYLHRRTARKALGASHASRYTSTIAMIIESAALIMIGEVAVIATSERNSIYTNLCLQILTQLEIIAPFLIIFRVVHGQAWSSQTARMLMKAESGVTHPGSVPSDVVQLTDFTRLSVTQHSSTQVTKVPTDSWNASPLASKEAACPV